MKALDAPLIPPLYPLEFTQGEHDELAAQSSVISPLPPNAKKKIRTQGERFGLVSIKYNRGWHYSQIARAWAITSRHRRSVGRTVRSVARVCSTQQACGRRIRSPIRWGCTTQATGTRSRRTRSCAHITRRAASTGAWTWPSTCRARCSTITSSSVSRTVMSTRPTGGRWATSRPSRDQLALPTRPDGRLQHPALA